MSIIIIKEEEKTRFMLEYQICRRLFMTNIVELIFSHVSITIFLLFELFDRVDRTLAIIVIIILVDNHVRTYHDDKCRSIVFNVYYSMYESTCDVMNNDEPVFIVRLVSRSRRRISLCVYFRQISIVGQAHLSRILFYP
jgi:hypothetical protein